MSLKKSRHQRHTTTSSAAAPAALGSSVSKRKKKSTPSISSDSDGDDEDEDESPRVPSFERNLQLSQSPSHSPAPLDNEETMEHFFNQNPSNCQGKDSRCVYINCITNYFLSQISKIKVLLVAAVAAHLLKTTVAEVVMTGGSTQLKTIAAVAVRILLSAQLE